MTGAVITVQMLDGGTREALRQLALLGTRPETLLRPIGTGMVRAVHDRFRSERDPMGQQWQALHPEYAQIKKGPGILRGAAMRGGLMGSITRDIVGAELAVGTNKVYGAIHQFGGVIRPKRAKLLFMRDSKGNLWGVAKQVTIPARPYLGCGTAEEEVVDEVVDAMFQRALSQAARRATDGF